MRRRFLILLLSISISPFIFCGGANESGANESAAHQLMVYVSIPPQAYLVERIGGGNVSVQVLVKPGKDPHTFDPSPKEMVSLAQSAIYFTIGFPFEEQLLAKIEKSNPQLAIITSDRGVKRRKPDVPGDHHSGQGAEEEHADEEHSDPHVWLSVRNSMIIAANIHRALAEADPGNADEYKMNLDLLLKDLSTLDNKISRLLQPLKGRDFFVFHPSFGYFADDYALNQVAVEIEGKSPTPRQIEYLIEQAQEAEVKIIFVQPQFDSRSASVIADSIQGTVISLDPLASDLIENFEDMAVKIEKALTH